MDENTKRFEWEVAELNFRHNYDKQLIIKWLRKYHDHYDSNETPDLSFLADLLDDKFAKGRGRPADNKIKVGLTQLLVKNTVDAYIELFHCSLEIAFEETTSQLNMSPSNVKKYYYRAQKSQVPPDNIDD
jgi:hypothetical protein